MIRNGEVRYGNCGYDEEVVFFLDHSCDEWVIGNLKDAKNFLKDLQKTIKQVEKGKK